MSRLASLVGRAVLGLVAAVVIVYVGDAVVLGLRKARYETLSRVRILAIPQKNGRIEYQSDQVTPTDTVTCVHALLRHGGARPCWYVKRHINDPIIM
jgi:hypothetical protein